MSRRQWLVLAAMLVAILVFAVAVDPALAQEESSGGSGIGDNIGEEVKSWGQALLLAVAALVGLPALFKRDTGQAMVIALIVLVLGGFVYGREQVEGVITTLWGFFSST
jgi:cobalamin synthase